jgi:secretion/DNA translocation related CpaE-like protein
VPRHDRSTSRHRALAVPAGRATDLAYGGARRPLLATAVPELLDDLLRLAAAADVEVDVAHDATAARRAWPSAPLVIAGADVLDDLLRVPPARRAGVVLVGTDLDDASVWARAVRLGAENVVFLPDEERWVVTRLAEAADGRRTDATTVAVIGGRGGAGATTLAAALAVTGARAGRQCLLVDADPLGGGIDLVLGAEHWDGVRWPELADARGQLNGATLTDALPGMEALTVLAFDRGDPLRVPPEAMQAVLTGASRGCDLVVVDLPRVVDDAAAVALSLSTTVLLVCPAEVRAVASAARVATAARPLCADLRVVVRGPSPSGLSADVVAESLDLPVAGFLNSERGLAAALERGEPPARRARGPLASFCRSLLDDLLQPRPAVA